MKKKHITVGACASAIALVTMAGAVSAQSAANATGLTAEQAIEIALLEVPGEVQEVELEQEDGSRVFEIEILAADDAEMQVEIDAETGMLLEVSTADDDD